MSSPANQERFQFSDEYLDFLYIELEFNSRGIYTEFKGVQYCRNDHLCLCTTCREREKFKDWPYHRSLTRILFYILTQRLYFNHKTDQEFIHYEDGLLIDYTNDQIRFKKYVQDICKMNNEFGTKIFDDFKKGLYNARNKRFQ